MGPEKRGLSWAKIGGYRSTDRCIARQNPSENTRRNSRRISIPLGRLSVRQKQLFLAWSTLNTRTTCGSKNLPTTRGAAQRGQERDRSPYFVRPRRRRYEALRL